MIWCFGFCLALLKLLVDRGWVTPCSPSLLKGNTQTTLVSSLHGQELPLCSHTLASPRCLRSWWPSGLVAPGKVFLARCPRHRWLQKQPASAVPSVLVETLCVFLLKAPWAALSVSQSGRAVSAGGQQGTPCRAAAAARAVTEQPVSSGNVRPEMLLAQPQVGFSACPAAGCRSKTTAGSYLKSYGAATAAVWCCRLRLGPGSNQGRCPPAAILGGREVRDATREGELLMTPALALK